MTAALDRMDALLKMAEHDTDYSDDVNKAAKTLVKIARIAATVEHERTPVATASTFPCDYGCRRCQIDKLLGELK